MGRKKEDRKKMPATAAKLYSLSGHSKKKKALHTEVKPIKELSDKDLRASNNFKRRSEWRD